MTDINHVVLVGRLTRDAELKYTNTGTAIAKFSIAVNRGRRVGDQWEDEAHFFDIVLWGKSAESLNQYLVKGKQVGVQGELRQSRWEQDGQPRSRVEVHAINVHLLGGRGQGSGGQGSGGQDYQNQGRPQRGEPTQSPEPVDDFEDDIPF